MSRAEASSRFGKLEVPELSLVRPADFCASRVNICPGTHFDPRPLLRTRSSKQRTDGRWIEQLATDPVNQYMSPCPCLAQAR